MIRINDNVAIVMRDFGILAEGPLRDPVTVRDHQITIDGLRGKTDPASVKRRQELEAALAKKGPTHLRKTNADGATE
jgi:hypothetical protein